MTAMKNNPNYYQERNLRNLDRIDALLEELPYFCEDFLRGVETRTSTLTRLNYVYDLRIFFDFLAKRKFRGKAVRDLTLEDIEPISPTIATATSGSRVTSVPRRASSRRSARCSNTSSTRDSSM